MRNRNLPVTKRILVVFGILCFFLFLTTTASAYTEHKTKFIQKTTIEPVKSSYIAAKTTYQEEKRKQAEAQEQAKLEYEKSQQEEELRKQEIIESNLQLMIEQSNKNKPQQNSAGTNQKIEIKYVQPDEPTYDYDDSFDELNEWSEKNKAEYDEFVEQSNADLEKAQQESDERMKAFDEQAKQDMEDFKKESEQKTQEFKDKYGIE